MKPLIIGENGGINIFSPAPDMTAAVSRTGRSYAEQHESGLTLLRTLLEIVYKITPPQIEIKNAPEGKPYLASRPEIYFNITHTDEYAAAVVCASETGIDMEHIRSGRPELVSRWLKPFTESDNPGDIDFTLAWTRFESYIKMTGRGMAEPDFSQPHVYYEYAGAGHILTICRKAETESL